MASRQGAFLSPFSQEMGRQQGGLGQLRCAEVVRRKRKKTQKTPNQIYLQLAIRLCLDLRLSKKQAGPCRTGQAANAFLPPLSSNMSRKHQKLPNIKTRAQTREQLLPRSEGFLPQSWEDFGAARARGCAVIS